MGDPGWGRQAGAVWAAPWAPRSEVGLRTWGQLHGQGSWARPHGGIRGREGPIPEAAGFCSGMRNQATGDSPCPGASGARTRARGHACLPGCMWAQRWATCSPRPRGLGTSQVPAESRDSSGLSPPSPGSKANPTAAARARSKATAPSSPTPPSAPPPAPRRSLLSGLQSRATAPQAGWSELHA